MKLSQGISDAFDRRMIQGILDLVSSVLQSALDKPFATAIELALIFIIVYAVLRFLHGTRGANLLQGLVTLLVIGFLVVRVAAERAQLDRITVLYEPFAWFVLLTTLLVFQPELRRGLMRLGETRFRRGQPSEINDIVRPITKACGWLSKNKIGGLIAIEGHVGLSGLIEHGVRVDARLTPELLNTIFWPGSALHDLGVVIQRGRLAAASVPFPLTEEDSVDRSIGSRHRAALGLSLESDAVIVVVSEETGTISIAARGRLHSHIPPESLDATLTSFLSKQLGTRAKEASEGEESSPEKLDDDESDPLDSVGDDPVTAHLPAASAQGDASKPAKSKPIEAVT